MSTGPRRELLYDDLAVGTRFRESRLHLSAQMLRSYAESIGDSALRDEADAGAGTPISDPSVLILFAITRRVLAEDGDVPAGGVLARQDLTPARPMRVGEIVRTTPSVHDKYERRGRRFLVLRCDLSDESGDSLGTVDNHIIWAR